MKLTPHNSLDNIFSINHIVGGRLARMHRKANLQLGLHATANYFPLQKSGIHDINLYTESRRVKRGWNHELQNRLPDLRP